MATLSSDTPVTPLRQRMLDDMAMRALRSRTQHDYVRHVRTFAAFLGRSPDTATAEDVRRFQLHQHESGASAPTINGAVSALRFLFGVTLDRLISVCPSAIHTRAPRGSPQRLQRGRHLPRRRRREDAHPPAARQINDGRRDRAGVERRAVLDHHRLGKTGLRLVRRRLGVRLQKLTPPVVDRRGRDIAPPRDIRVSVCWRPRSGCVREGLFGRRLPVPGHELIPA